MKRISVLLLMMVAAATIVQAQPPQVKVTIHAATVFLNGAELASTARVTLPQGESDVIFTNVAGSVNQQSLSIGAGNGVVIQSATFQNNYLADSSISPRGNKLQDTMAVLKQDIAAATDKKTVVDEQLVVLRENKKVSGQNNGLSVAELQKLLDLMNTRMNGLLTTQRTLAADIEKKNARLVLLQNQLNEEQKKNYQPGGQLLVKFYAAQPTTATINMTYVVPNAGWSPTYDLRVEKVNDPVRLAYKANVYQNCGVSWNNIKLSLSTGNPNEGAEAPMLSPNYLSFYNPGMAAGRANMIQMNRAQMAPAPEMKKALRELSYKEDEVVYPSTINEYTTVDNSGINTSFDIDLPYTIPSDGQQHTVAVKSYDLPATYRYFAVPRLDKDAFLQAQITQWEDLNLLPASTNVFFEGSYVGQGYIDMRNVRDTMNLSLGRDKKIIIRRERDKDLHSKKVIGSNERQSFTYSISVRNTRKEKINLVILDQVPVSNDKDIVVEDATYGNASYEETTGALRWSMEVKPAELQKVTLGYTVKYPKGRVINGLR